jgi:hypothetical protein
VLLLEHKSSYLLHNYQFEVIFGLLITIDLEISSSNSLSFIRKIRYDYNYLKLKENELIK